jgi:hypothetical protein
MSIARLDMVVQIMLIARIVRLEMVVQIMLIVALLVCVILEPTQAITSSIAQSLQLLPSMDLEMVIGLSIRHQQHKRLLHRSIWFVLMQSCQEIQQFFIWHFRLPLLISGMKRQRKLSFVSFGIQEPVLQ